MSKHKTLRCKTPGCDKPHHAHGLCQHCYDNLRKRKPGGAKSAGKARVLAGLKGKDGKNKPDDANIISALGSEAFQGVTGRGQGGPGSPEAARSSRLLLIKARHEAMKREIDQIREDLETEGED